MIDAAFAQELPRPIAVDVLGDRLLADAAGEIDEAADDRAFALSSRQSVMSSPLSSLSPTVASSRSNAFDSTHAGQLEPGRRRIIIPAVSDDEARERFPDGWKTVRPYLRIVAQPQ